MAATKLTKKQREELKAGIAALEPVSVLCKRFGITRQNIQHYLDAHEESIKAIQASNLKLCHNRGYLNRDYRLAKRSALAERLEEILFREPEPVDLSEFIGAPKPEKPKDLGGFYYIEMKVSPNGKIVEYPVFNAPLVNAYRAAMDDIGKETGQMPNKLEISGPDGGPLEIKGYTTLANPEMWPSTNPAVITDGNDSEAE